MIQANWICVKLGKFKKVQFQKLDKCVICQISCNWCDTHEIFINAKVTNRDARYYNVVKWCGAYVGVYRYEDEITYIYSKEVSWCAQVLQMTSGVDVEYYVLKFKPHIPTHYRSFIGICISYMPNACLIILWHSSFILMPPSHAIITWYRFVRA